jgi:outer membrane protein OmpA-like peptidoglycan-associated protein
MSQAVSLGALIAIGVCLPARPAQAQSPAHVRVAIDSARIMRWLGPQTDVVLVADQGTILEVIDYDRDEDSYWVVLPRDVHGTRKAGWIHASLVEMSETPAAAPRQVQRDDEQAQAPADASPSATADTPAASEDKVTISVRRDSAAASSPDAAGATKSYAFEDLHFERDSFSIRSEDIDRLRVAVTALKDDPSVVVMIEGHTCSLGTPAYNLALGNRRANAVKEFLVNAGVPADRLSTISVGEADAEYDNSREETRRLNRRVALVPKVQR